MKGASSFSEWKLVGYIIAARKLGHNERVTFIASDSAPINGLHMQLSLISYNNNSCLVAPPGVLTSLA